MEAEQWTKQVPSKVGFYRVKVKGGRVKDFEVEIFKEYKFFGKLMIKPLGTFHAPYKFRLKEADNIIEWKRLNK